MVSRGRNGVGLGRIRVPKKIRKDHEKGQTNGLNETQGPNDR